MRPVALMFALAVASAAAAQTAADCPAPATATARLQVVDERGEPIRGASVTLTTYDADLSAQQVVDANGEAAFACYMPAQDYLAVISRPGFVTTIVNFDLTVVSDPVRVQLQPARGHYVRVICSGAGVPGAVVTLQEPGGSEQDLVTDDDGFAACAPLRNDGSPVTLRVCMEGFRPLELVLDGDAKQEPVSAAIVVIRHRPMTITY